MEGHFPVGEVFCMVVVRRWEMKTKELGQQQIIQGLKDADSEVIDDFIQQFSRPLFGVILNYTKNPPDAEEILQDTLLRVIRKIDTFRQESDIWPWMKRIAINNSIMWLPVLPASISWSRIETAQRWPSNCGISKWKSRRNWRTVSRPSCRSKCKCGTNWTVKRLLPSVILFPSPITVGG